MEQREVNKIEEEIQVTMAEAEQGLDDLAVAATEIGDSVKMTFGGHNECFQ